jgi:uncharacterized protein
MKIDLTELLRKVGNESHLHLESKLSFPDDGLTLTKPVKMELDLFNNGNSVLLQGSLATEAELACSRCLNNFRKKMTVKLAEEYVRELPLPAGKKGGRETELREKDFVYPIEKDNTIDLTEIIRQNLLLAMPIRILCQENCKPKGE